MNAYLETLNILQRRVLPGLPAGQGADPKSAELRAKVPAPILAHFDRLVAQGRKAVAEARNGICGACHLRMPASEALSSPHDNDLHVCAHCGAYLIFPTVEPVAVEPKRPARRGRPSARSVAPVAAQALGAV